MNNLPALWIVAGPNGAGKTTCVQKDPINSIIPAVHFLNPDDIAKQKLIAQGFLGFIDAPEPLQQKAFIESAIEVQKTLDSSIEEGIVIGVETVLSTDKYRPHC